jgi:hypothetical protein
MADARAAVEGVVLLIGKAASSLTKSEAGIGQKDVLCRTPDPRFHRRLMQDWTKFLEPEPALLTAVAIVSFSNFY